MSIDAVGIWFFSVKTNRHLYLMRNDKKYNGYWGLPGGKVEAGESLLDTIKRECIEEMGVFPEYIKLTPIEQFTSPHQAFTYHTFYCIVDDEFTPVLNHEHIGYAWVDSSVIPTPLHPGLWSTVNTNEISERLNSLKGQYAA